MGIPHREASLRVLVVDDEPDTAESLAALVELWGHEVRIAADGRTALAAIADKVPDVILLDLGLPGITGWDVARRVHQIDRTKRPFLVAITGFADDDARAISGSVGIDIHLTKPIELEPLAALLKRLRSVVS